MRTHARTHTHTTFPPILAALPTNLCTLPDLHRSDSQVPSLTHTAPLSHCPQFAVCLFVYPCWLRNSRSWKLPSLKNTDIDQETNFIPRLKLFFLILAIVTESCKSDILYSLSAPPCLRLILIREVSVCVFCLCLLVLDLNRVFPLVILVTDKVHPCQGHLIPYSTLVSQLGVQNMGELP